MTSVVVDIGTRAGEVNGHRQTRRIGAVAAVLLALFVHGIQANSLGIYWDDGVQLTRPFQEANYDKGTFILSDPTFEDEISRANGVRDNYVRQLGGERPGLYLAFMMERAAFTFGLNTVHWTVVGLFVLTVALVTRLARRLLDQEWFVFAVGTIFAIYPLAPLQTFHPPAMGYHLSCLLALASIFASLRYAEAKGGQRWCWLIAAGVAYGLSLLTHEVFAFVPPGFLAAWLMTAEIQAAPSAAASRRDGWSGWFFAMPRLGVFAVVFALYAVWRTQVQPLYGVQSYKPTWPFGLSHLVTNVIEAGVTALLPWPRVIFFLYAARPAAIWVACALAVGAATFLISALLLRVRSDTQQVEGQSWTRTAFVGLAVFMAAVAVFAVSPVPLRAVFGVDFHNRGNYGVMTGLALAVPSLLMLFTRWERRSPAPAAATVLAGLLWLGLIGWPETEGVGLLFYRSYNPVFLGYSITYGLVMIAYGLAVFGNAATIVLTLQSRRRQSRPTAVRNEGPDVQTASCFVLSAALAAIATLGSLAHFETKAQFTEAWNRQLDMMQALRQLAPGLSNDTFVVVVDDRDYSQPWSSHDNASSYLLALYDNPSVQGNTLNHLHFHPDGVESTHYDDRRWVPPDGRVAYNRLVLFKYAAGTLRALPEIEVTTINGQRLVVKSHPERIRREGSPPARIWRYLER